MIPCRARQGSLMLSTRSSSFSTSLRSADIGFSSARKISCGTTRIQRETFRGPSRLSPAGAETRLLNPLKPAHCIMVVQAELKRRPQHPMIVHEMVIQTCAAATLKC
jgi:hypothetical protein